MASLRGVVWNTIEELGLLLDGERLAALSELASPLLARRRDVLKGAGRAGPSPGRKATLRLYGAADRQFQMSPLPESPVQAG